MTHLWLPATLFSRLSDDFDLPNAPAHSARYVSAIRDGILNSIGLSILSEMSSETSVGRMYVETESLMLAAHIIRRYCDSGSCSPTATVPISSTKCGSDKFSISFPHIMVIKITLADLAQVAGLSTFHFARMFTRAVGLAACLY
jgi:AraC family transcriptional regulator